ncbi:glycosyltransferase [Bacillus sp. C1]
MELIRWAVELGNSVHGNTPHELFPVLEYYYDRDHLKAFLITGLLLETELSPDQREAVELKRCVSAFYAGLYEVGKKYADKLLAERPEAALYQSNVRAFEAQLNRTYDYCLYIWPYTYGNFIDVARALKWKLEQQGKTVVISEKPLSNAKDTVIFGAHSYAHIPAEIPEDAIIYNLEQLYDGSPYDNVVYHNILRNRVVWDYSSQNIEWLNQKGLGKELTRVKMNYAPTLKIKTDAFSTPVSEDIDVLFIGFMNERRQAILDQLRQLAPDLNVEFKSNVWGVVRNELIARAKIVLNIHYYLTGILEAPRISHAVANHKFIISESSNPNDEAEWPGIVFVPHEKIAETIVEYLQKPEEREMLAKQAHDYFQSQGEINPLFD